jgi:hypothetical protein
LNQILVDPRPDDDLRAETRAESLNFTSFSNKLSGKLHVRGISFRGMTVGDVVTDGYGAETTGKRVGVALPGTGSVRYRSGNAVHEAVGLGALYLQ